MRHYRDKSLYRGACLLSFSTKDLTLSVSLELQPNSVEARHCWKQLACWCAVCAATASIFHVQQLLYYIYLYHTSIVLNIEEFTCKLYLKCNAGSDIEYNNIHLRLGEKKYVFGLMINCLKTIYSIYALTVNIMYICPVWMCTFRIWIDSVLCKISDRLYKKKKK